MAGETSTLSVGQRISRSNAADSSVPGPKIARRTFLRNANTSIGSNIFVQQQKLGFLRSISSHDHCQLTKTPHRAEIEDACGHTGKFGECPYNNMAIMCVREF